MCHMIDRVRIDSLLHCLSPLLVGDRNISNWPPDCPSESFDNFPHCWSFAHHRVSILRRHSGVSQKGGGYAGYIFRTGERNDVLVIAPRQECGILLGYAPADQSAYVFVIGRRLKMNGPNLCPIEDAIGQPMLQIPE